LFTYDQRSILLSRDNDRDNDNSLPFVVVVVFALSTILEVPFLLFLVLLLILPLRDCVGFLFSLSLLMILEEFFRLFVVPATTAVFFFLFFPSISDSNLATLAFCGGRDDLDNLFLLLLLYLLEDNDDDDFDDDDDDDSKGRLRGFLFSILITSITNWVVFASNCMLSGIFHKTVVVVVVVAVHVQYGVL
jgi:hypothetical protein